MAAPTNEVVGVNVLVKSGGTLIGGQTGLDLEKSLNQQEVADKSQGFWSESIPGFEESTISVPNAYTGTGGDHVLGENNSVKVELTDQQGNVTETVQGVQELTCTFESDLEEIQTFQTSNGAKEYRVTGQSMDLSFSAHYFDPAATNGAAHDLVLAAEENDEYLTLTLTFGNLSIEGQIRPTDWTLSAPAENELATFEPSFRHNGALTRSGSIQGGLDVLLNSFFNRTQQAINVEYDTGSGAVTGSTEYTGVTYISSAELTGTQGEPLELNYDLQVTGGLVRSTV